MHESNNSNSNNATQRTRRRTITNQLRQTIINMRMQGLSVQSISRAISILRPTIYAINKTYAHEQRVESKKRGGDCVAYLPQSLSRL
jgi:transposase-like protein